MLRPLLALRGIDMDFVVGVLVESWHVLQESAVYVLAGFFVVFSFLAARSLRVE